MNFEDTLNAITTKFADDIATPESLTVVYDNDGATVQPENTNWVRLTVLFGAARQITLGSSRRWRVTGIMLAQVFTPAGSGSAAGIQIADAITAVFRSRTESGITYKTPEVTIIGRSDAFHQINVSVEFWVDDLE